LGAENLLNYMQHMPVIAADQPFSPFFDASMIWGPTMGSTLYVGFRMTIK
jgi:outer membrane receptor for ferrienterochelin and colicins